MTMPRLDSLFDGPRPMRVVLQKFFVVIGFDHERLHFAQSLDHHLRRVTEIGDEAETAGASVKSKTERIDSIVRHGERLHPDIANGELGAGCKNSPVSMSIEEAVAPKCFRREPIAINRHVKLSAQDFEPADVITVFVSKKDAIELLRQDTAFRQAQHQLSRAQPAIDQDLAMLGRDQRAVPRAPAAEHGQAEHGT